MNALKNAKEKAIHAVSLRRATFDGVSMYQASAILRAKDLLSDDKGDQERTPASLTPP